MKMKKKKRLAKFLAGLLVLVLIGLAMTYVLYTNLSKPAADESDAVLFEIKSGEVLRTVASNLEQQGIVRSAIVVEITARLDNLTGLKAGVFVVDKSWSVTEVLQTINDSTKTIVDTVRITFPEGDWARDFAHKISNLTSVEEQQLLDLWNNDVFLDEMIAKYEFLSEDILNPKTRIRLEGYLFPNTYEFFVSTNPRDVTIKLLDQTKKIYDKYKAQFEASDLSVHEVFILASIVQFEASKPEDMKKVASVFFNRLEIDMALQSSVTVCYSLYEYDSWRDCETNSNFDSPYNTYKYRGLPVGPIMNPGEDAIAAVLDPADTDYYYFMADVYGDGTVYYAKTYAEHNANVEKYLKGR
jgi:UPF0755 protein